jgi:HSP20 family protein
MKLISRRNRSEVPVLTHTERLFEDIDRMFENLWNGFPWWWGPVWRPQLAQELAVTKFAPRIEVSENDKGYVISAELPGLNKEDIQVTLDGSVLTIKGEKKEEQENKKDGYYYSERVYGSFARSLELPSDADPAKLKASFKNGVLRIEVEKQESSKRAEVIKIED